MVLQRGGSGVGVIRAPAWYSNGSRYLSRTNQAVNLLDDQFLELGTDQDAVLTLSRRETPIRPSSRTVPPATRS
jgi:hypothetical protein